MAVTLTVEDGSIVSGANSYVSLVEAEAYYANRPDTNWTAGTNDTKSTALIKATDYLLQRFRMKWKGIRVQREQALDWPRKGVITEDYYQPVSGARPSLLPDLAYEIPEDEIPQEVKDATLILAAKVLAGTDLNADIERLTKREKVGELEVDYADYATARTQYLAVMDRLKPLLQPTDGRILRV